MKPYIFVLSCAALYLFMNIGEVECDYFQLVSHRLFPHPRIGRGESFPITWGFPDDKYKREGGLIPFPRVGRNVYKRNGGGSSGALWFGPRLGKVQKRFSSVDLNNEYPSDEDQSFFLKNLKTGDDYSTFSTEPKPET